MHKKDTMIEEIHQIRKKMWDKSHHDPHTLIENIQKEAEEFIGESGYRNKDTKDGYSKIVKKK